MSDILKVDLHLHTSEDKKENVRHNSFELIDEAWRQGFDVISITNHDMITWSRDLERHALRRGVLLIPGVELTVQGCHVLVIGELEGLEQVRRLGDLRRVKRPGTLIAAPHPFYPGAHGLGRRLYQYLPLFDLIEYCHFHHPVMDFNREALALSSVSGVPLAGFSDSHNLWQFGSTYSLVMAERNRREVLRAMKEGELEVVSEPLSLRRVLRTGWWMVGNKVRRPMPVTSRRSRLRWVSPAMQPDRGAALLKPLPGESA